MEEKAIGSSKDNERGTGAEGGGGEENTGKEDGCKEN